MQCDIEKDPRHPEQWRKAYPLYEIESKSSILKICNERYDEVAARVWHHMEAVLVDLHAEDARYHLNCRQRFNSSRAVGGLSLECKKGSDDDLPLDSLVSIRTKDKSRIWNYVECGGELISCR